MCNAMVRQVSVEISVLISREMSQCLDLIYKKGNKESHL